MDIVAVSVNQPCPFEQICNPPLTEDHVKLDENRSRGFREEVGQRCGRTNEGRTDNGRQVITIAHPEPSLR